MRPVLASMVAVVAGEQCFGKVLLCRDFLDTLFLSLLFLKNPCLESSFGDTVRKI